MKCLQQQDNKGMICLLQYSYIQWRRLSYRLLMASANATVDVVAAGSGSHGVGVMGFDYCDGDELSDSAVAKCTGLARRR